MDAAILHYHLHRGGVTQVIVNHLRALAAAVDTLPNRVVILHGGRDNAWPQQLAGGALPFDVAVVPVAELEYDDLRDHACDARQVADAIQAALAQCGLDKEETVLHVHNHALGKHAALPGGLATLACRGWAQLLQIHDFAEDFRPTNYRSILRGAALETHDDVPRYAYPQAPQIHYAVLTQHDRQVLARAGIPRQRLHLLANPVVAPTELPDRLAAREKIGDRCGLNPQQRWMFYPVRGIRRKNLGELLLWAALNGEAAEWAVTQQPLNPREATSYHHWKRTAAALQLPCAFGIGEHDDLDFGELMAAADGLVTTSVAEGFGMVFLEAPLLGRPLVGRDLPDVTADFRGHGLDFPGLRSSLPLAVDQGLRQRGRQQAELLYREARTAYGLGEILTIDAQREFETMFAAPQIDFALLGRDLQTELLQSLVGAPPSSELSHWQAALWSRWEALAASVGPNAARVRDAYGLATAGSRLSEVYRAVRASARAPRTEPLEQGEQILASFLQPGRLRPCRLET